MRCSPRSGCCSTPSRARAATRPSKKTAGAITSAAATATTSGAGCARAPTSRGTTATARASSSRTTSLPRLRWTATSLSSATRWSTTGDVERIGCTNCYLPRPGSLALIRKIRHVNSREEFLSLDFISMEIFLKPAEIKGYKVSDYSVSLLLSKGHRPTRLDLWSYHCLRRGNAASASTPSCPRPSDAPSEHITDLPGIHPG